MWELLPRAQSAAGGVRPGMAEPARGPDAGQRAPLGTGVEIVITDHGRPVLKLVPYRGDRDSPAGILRETVLRYDDPIAPVASHDWEALD